MSSEQEKNRRAEVATLSLHLISDINIVECDHKREPKRKSLSFHFTHGWRSLYIVKSLLDLGDSLERVLELL
jgi:hypothetical protein